jgi:hypothetical protein
VTLAEKLASAETALHSLITGTLAVEVDTGDFRTRFTQADVAKLQAYIGQLKQEIAGQPVRGAIGIYF